MTISNHSDSDRKKPMSKTAAWLPPADNSDTAERLPTLKVHKLAARTDTTDVLTRLKISWLGRMYIDHLKKFPLIRQLSFETWQFFFPLYARSIVALTSHTARDWRPLVKLADYVDRTNISPVEVLSAARVETPPPRVLPAKDQALLISPHDFYDFPSIYVAEINDAEVNGGTNLVFVHDAVICHDLYDFKRDYTSEELHGRHVLDRKKARLSRVKGDNKQEQMPAAAVFLDACASNYAHWLTEVLPRIAAFCSVKQYANIPILVDDGLHHNIMESLELVVGKNREVIALPVGRAIKVDKLYVTSVTGYVPFDRRNTKLANYSHGLFSPLAMDLVKSSLLHAIEKRATQDWPKKIYLRRNAGPRQIINNSDVQKVLLENGFTVIEPEKLTFLQQLILFSNAEDVVSPSGAALANQIFVHPEAKIHILIGEYADTSYWYWQNMACASGREIIYSLGKLQDRKPTIHSDFAIDPDVFKDRQQAIQE